METENLKKLFMNKIAILYSQHQKNYLRKQVKNKVMSATPSLKSKKPSVPVKFW